MKYQGLRELHQITQYKDGCVYRTKKIKRVWIDLDPIPEPPKDHMFCSLSSNIQLELGMKGTIRRVQDDVPSIVDWTE